MIGKLFGLFWTLKASQEWPKRFPKAAKMEPKTRKKRCLKTRCFQTRFFHGLEVIFDGFSDDFWNPKFAKIAKTAFLRKPENYLFSLTKIDIFKVSKAWTLNEHLSKNSTN